MKSAFSQPDFECVGEFVSVILTEVGYKLNA